MYPANAGHKGDIVAQQDWLHMNAYSVFLSPRLQTGSKLTVEEQAKDRGKLEDTGIRHFFGKDIVPWTVAGQGKVNSAFNVFAIG